MTTNQTIDGVPRACDALKCLTESFRHALQRGIQPSFSMGDLEFFIKTFEELRALLDAPAKAEFSIPDCPDCACVQDGQCLCIPSKPVAQPQGEPVAEIVSKYGDPEAFGERELITLKDISKFPYGTKLYADQPAPVASNPQCQSCQGRGSLKDADGMDKGYCGPCDGSGKALGSVVIPKRMDVPSADCPERINAQGWNACLDELKRLNPSL